MKNSEMKYSEFTRKTVTMSGDGVKIDIEFVKTDVKGWKHTEVKIKESGNMNPRSYFNGNSVNGVIIQNFYFFYDTYPMIIEQIHLKITEIENSNE